MLGAWVRFLRTADRRCYFCLDQIQMAAGDNFEKNSNSYISATCYPLHVSYVHRHSDTVMTVEAYDRKLDTYFAREGN